MRSAAAEAATGVFPTDNCDPRALRLEAEDHQLLGRTRLAQSLTDASAQFHTSVHQATAMAKSCHSSADSPSSATANNSSSVSNATAAGAHLHSSLKSPNKASYKITKPVPRRPNLGLVKQQAALTTGGGGAPSQPPVYNIDKSDFRSLVQKLTGSATHRHQLGPAAPPPSAPGPPPTSRLHRIRPPPLAHLAPRPLLMDSWTRPPPLSPLPPLPTVSAAAESPISAYMRRLQNGCLPDIQPSLSATLVLPPLGSPLPSPGTAYEMMVAQGLVLPPSPVVQLPSSMLGEP
ncbi:VQ motif [Musa troglodytarum]|uniref:VQ motif n=1 Tax=Musa troglodytarum TaxID=320322 RepID=A0A9E7EC04_9LILI|nr:VQ motif [Musa troglodytarum]